MKNYWTIFIILTAFIGFSIFDIESRSSCRVLEVLDADRLIIDLNSNRKIDENETICADDVYVFSSDYKKDQKVLADKFNISEKDAYAAGYLSKKYAADLLAGQKVKIKFTDKRLNNCRTAKITINNRDYKTLLLNAGYETSTSKIINPEILKKARKLNLVIYNHKSLKYHEIGCKYGESARDAVLIPYKDLPVEALPCKYCHINKKAQKEHPETIPVKLTNSNIKMYLSDFTVKLKPDTDCTSVLCKALLNEINLADKSIDIAAYGWDNNKTLNNALQKAVIRGVKIRLVYETNTKNTSFYPYTFEFAKRIKNSRSDFINGNAKETNWLMHNKFIIIDNKKVCTGSTNFSFTGLSGYNANVLIIIDSKDIAQVYTDEFEQMYSGKFHLQKNKSDKNKKFKINNGNAEVFFMPQDKGITDGIIPLVNAAKQYIYIPAFLITHREMASALINAKRRGVDVKIIIDATNASNRSSAHQILRDSGIPVKTENYAGKMHLKSVIIDDRYTATGSMNFSYSGENRNDENLIIIENMALAEFYKNYFTYIWNKIPDKWLKYNAKAESRDSIGSCFDGIDNDFDGKIDALDEGCMKK